MTPLMQTLVTVAIVVVALAYVGRRAWATLAKGKGGGDKPCGPGCH